MFDRDPVRERQAGTNDTFCRYTRSAHGFVSAVAAVVAVTFTMMILAPAAMAARAGIAESRAPAASTRGAEARFASTSLKIRSTLEKLLDRLSRNEDVALERNELRALFRTLRQLDKVVRAGFDATGKMIRDKGLPPVIHRRHDQTAAAYRAAFDALAAELAIAGESGDRVQVKQSVRSALGQLNSTRFRRRHQPFEPKALRDITAPDPGNVPRMSRDEYLSAGLHDRPLVRLAANEGFRLDGLPGASSPAFLAETPEVRLSRVIRGKAAELGHDPVTIYHWVRNNIEWLPTWGARQDAELTLVARRGNSMEIAGLTLALMRASGIPARYVHGVVEVPAQEFVNWAGDFADAAAARDYIARGGIPSSAVVSGGQIRGVRLEHVWVEVAADYYPSRGAINKAADRWVRLDPSFKQYESLEGVDVMAVSGVDPEILAGYLVASGNVNEAEGWVSGFDPGILRQAADRAALNIEDYLANKIAEPAVADVIGARRTITQEFPTLPSSLDNRVVFEGATYDALPDRLRLHLTLALGKGPLGEPVNPVSYRLSEINNRKLTLSFRLATVADEQVLASLLPAGEITDIGELPDYVPAYLVSVIPELKRDGELIQSGPAIRLGDEIALYYQVRAPVQTFPSRTYHVVAGSYLALTTVGGSVSPVEAERTRSRMQRTKSALETRDQAQLAALTGEELQGDMFHGGLLGYWAQYNALGYLAALSHRASMSLAVGYGSFGYEPEVDTLFGIPRGIRPGGVAMNVYLTNYDATHAVDAGERKNLNIRLGALSSALEHGVPEQMFNTDATTPPDAVSAVKALHKANALGQRIYRITRDNLAAVLPMLELYSETESEIRQAVLAGKTVITHTHPISVPSWQGAGYVILDPDTGVGAWKISGGANGSVLIFETILNFFWWGFDRIKGIAKANVVISAINFLNIVTTIVSQCGGGEQWRLSFFVTAYTLFIVLLSIFVTPAVMLAYATLFNILATLVFDQAIQRDCYYRT